MNSNPFLKGLPDSKAWILKNRNPERDFEGSKLEESYYP